MDEIRPFTPILAAVSVVLSVWLLLPRLLVVLGMRKMENGFSAGPEDAIRNSFYGVDDDLMQKLTALRFAPVGVYWERSAMGRTFIELVFVSEAEQSYAMLYPNQQIMPRRAAFLTVFSDGAVVFTKNYHGGVEGQSPTYIAGAPPKEAAAEGTSDVDGTSPLSKLALVLVAVLAGGFAFYLKGGVELEHLNSGMIVPLLFFGGVAVVAALLRIKFGPQTPSHSPGPDLDSRFPLEEVLREHRARVAVFMEAGREPIIGQQEAWFLEAQQKYHAHPYVRERHQSAELGNLVFRVMVILALPVLLGLNYGIEHPALWLCLGAEGVLGLVMRYGLSSAQVIRGVRLLSEGRAASNGQRPN